MTIRAILVAVSDYSGIGQTDIPCVGDLYAVKKALIKGLNVCHSDINLYGESKTVTRDDLRDIVEKVKAYDESDIVLFYYSGHGGDGKICLSDACLSVDSLIEFFKGLPQIKILVFDSCHSGVAQINNETSFEEDIDRMNNNCVVFASCREHEVSGFNPFKNISLYTSFFCEAITCDGLIKQGKKSIDDIASYVQFLAKKWEEKYNAKQHPVFRSSIVGTLQLQVQKYTPYKPDTFSYDCNDYSIFAVEPTHICNKMRYAVKVVLKGGKKLEELSVITSDIVQRTSCLQIFNNEITEKQHKGNKAKVIFCYFGYDQEDAQYCTWAYRTTWAEDDSDKSIFYRKDEHSKVINGIWVCEQTDYGFIRSMRIPYISEEEFISQTTELFKELLMRATEFIRIFREGDNGTISEEERRSLLFPIASTINDLYYKMGNLPACYETSQKWFDDRFVIAGDIADMALPYQWNNYKNWDDKNRDYLVKSAIDRFQVGYGALGKE